MGDVKGKKTYLLISSSSSSDEEQDIDDDEDYGSVEEDEDSSASISSGDQYELSDDEIDDDYDDQAEDSTNNGDVDSVYNRVTKLLQDNRDLQELTLNECKSYLRRHGLRVSGTKDICLQRILQHRRIKDGNGEALYPRSSFSINCTGDVCKGDTVLFTQRVFERFDKMKRRGKEVGRRTIAGQVVKESYGADKQQHTFTVEVLWSYGIKKLPPLFPLLVKGRNLYKMKTFRQPWRNETERSKVLAEKHRRGTMARRKRSMRQGKAADRGSKRRKVHHCKGPSEKGVTVKAHGRASSRRLTSYPEKAQKIKQPTAKQTSSKGIQPPQRPFHDASQRFQQQRLELYDGFSPCYRKEGMLGSSSSGRFPYETLHRGDSQRATNYSHEYERFRVSHYPQMIPHRPLQHFPSGFDAYRQGSVNNCSTRGCQEFGSNGCVMLACWICCRRAGVRCYVHQ